MPSGPTQDYTRARLERQELGEQLWREGLHIRQLRDSSLARRFATLADYEGPVVLARQLPPWSPHERVRPALFDRTTDLPCPGQPTADCWLLTAKYTGRILAETFYEFHAPVFLLNSPQRMRYAELLADSVQTLTAIPEVNTVPYAAHPLLDDLLSDLRVWFFQEYAPPALWPQVPNKEAFRNTLEDAYALRMHDPWLYPSVFPPLLPHLP